MTDHNKLARTDLNLLVLFDVLATELHVGRAAQKLNLSPSAVSHGLARLRRTLNDALFLKRPRGMVPTDKALELRQPVADILASVGLLFAAAEPFEPKTSKRVFRIGTADGFSNSLTEAISVVEKVAPGIQLVLTNLQRETAVEDLDNRKCDIAVAPFADLPARFISRALYKETFVVAMRQGHPFATSLTLENYCTQSHILVAPRGEPRSPLDDIIEARGLKRHISVAVPNFFMALDLLKESDLVTILPGHFVRANQERFGVQSVALPLELGDFIIKAVVPKSALTDHGVSWLFNVLVDPCERSGSTSN